MTQVTGASQPRVWVLRPSAVQSPACRRRPPTVYRLAPAVVARFVGLALVGLALLLFVGTAVVALAGLPAGPPGRWWCSSVCWPAAGLGWWLRARAWVLRCTDDGYRVRLVRGAGVTEARWSQVEDAVTTYRRDVACLELRLRDGRTTTIPVGVLAVDGRVRARAPGPVAARPRLRPLLRTVPAVEAAGFDLPGDVLVACSAEASPSPVYGARLLSGLGLQPSRGFKSRRLRRVSPRRQDGSHPGGGSRQRFLTFFRIRRVEPGFLARSSVEAPIYRSGSCDRQAGLST